MSAFITFEGIEGSGKSTQIRALAARLRERGHHVVETREPGGTTSGAVIRRLVLAPEGPPLTPITELLLYCADRAQHLAQVIRPALAAGQTVLCDRFSDSTIAYQAYGRGLDLAATRALDGEARGSIGPGLTFLLDCPVDVGLRRARSRAGTTDRYEREALEFHARVREGFHALAAAEPERFRVVDSTRPPEAVRTEIEDAATRHLESVAARSA